MPKLIPLVSIGVSREVNGKARTVYPPIGQVFEFTVEEVEHVRDAHKPNPAFRRPVNEAPEVTSAEDDGDDGLGEEGATETAATTRRAAPKKGRAAVPGPKRAAAEADEDEL